MIKLKDLLKEQNSFFEPITGIGSPKAGTKAGSAFVKAGEKAADFAIARSKDKDINVITDSEFRAAMTKLANTWNPIRNQYKGKTVNFYKIGTDELLGNFKIENIIVKYYAGKEELAPYVVVRLSGEHKGTAYAYEQDLKRNMFKVGKSKLGTYMPEAPLMNKELTKSILSKWPAIDRIAGELSNIKEKQRVPDADFTAAIDSELGNDDIQSTNIA